MNGIGKIWFSSKNINIGNKYFVEFCIRNSNSFIAEEFREKIFELKFTMGKETGNGIGLYSVRSLIEEAGGRIYCTASKERGVEFIFTLPSSQENISLNQFILPKNSSEVLKIREDNYKKVEKNCNHKDQSSIKEALIKNKIKMSILIIDDEECYLNSITQVFLDIFPKNECFISVNFARTYEDAIISYEEYKPQIIICDIDLKDSAHDGFNLISHIRPNDKETYICVHTNRIFTEKQIQSLGGNKYISKPLTEINLFEIFADYLKNKSISLDNKVENKEKIIVVDDKEIYLDMWKNSLYDAEVLTFIDPESFFDILQENKEILNSISCIILDYFFDGKKFNIVEMNFVDLLRRYGYKNPCFLSSEVICSKEELSIFDGFLEKKPHSFSEIKSIFPDCFK